MKDDIDPAQLRAARGLVKWSRDRLASKAGTTERTIARIEDGDGKPRASTAQAIRSALEKAGVEFIAENGGGPGVRLQEAKRKAVNSDEFSRQEPPPGPRAAKSRRRYHVAGTMGMPDKSQRGCDMIAAQCKGARAMLGLGVRDLAKAAGVSTNTVSRLERGEELGPRTIRAVREALEAAGAEFIAENGGGPGVRLKKRKGKR
jgi:transcriptional regulator with XRE-family HTH domain